MRITYTYQIFFAQRYGGISRYFFEIASRLAERPDCDVTVLAPAHINAYLADATRARVVGRRIARTSRTGRAERLVNELSSHAWLALHRPDVVHETYFSPRPLAPRGTPTVLTVYDMIIERFPEYFSAGDRLPAVKAAMVRRADHVICISEQTRRDLIEYVPEAAAKSSVIHLGHTLRGAPGSRSVAAPYVLYVGERGGYKNFRALVCALGASSLGRGGVALVCFGGGAFTADEQAALTAAGFAGARSVQVGGDDDVLATLYAHALLFAYPSLYEGFGIPPLEAMALGCPVVCAAAGSLPEVVGAAAELFDPTDVGAMAAALERVATSPGRADELRAAGRAQAARFSWELCADRTRTLYRTLA